MQKTNPNPSPKLFTVFFLKFLLIILVPSTYGQKVKNHDKAPNKDKGELIFAEDFSSGFDTVRWISEIEPFSHSSVYVKEGQLHLNTKGGVTVWFNQLLKGNIRIEYTRKIILEKGPNDRVSDLNNFWMAKDPLNQNLFTRNGKFESYDSLSLYYVGMGGNTNTTTRFRKYKGNGEKPLLHEWLDKDYLLQPNVEYKIIIIVKNNMTSFWVNGKRFFAYSDPEILKEGYFGFRSTYSHQVIDNFKIYKLK